MGALVLFGSTRFICAGDRRARRPPGGDRGAQRCSPICKSELHAGKRVLTTFFWIAGHRGKIPFFCEKPGLARSEASRVSLSGVMPDSANQ